MKEVKLTIPFFTLNDEELDNLVKEVNDALRARKSHYGAYWEKGLSGEIIDACERQRAQELEEKKHLNEVTVGDISQVLGHQWVEVLNKKSVQSGNSEFVRGDYGSINVGGVVTVLAVDNEKVLVEYELNREAYGAPLSSGVIFYLSRKDFLSMKPIEKASLGKK